MGFGIYFDDPEKLVDRSKARCVGGIVLEDHEIDSETTRNFLAEHKRFKYKYLKKCPALFTYFPYMNYASFQIAEMKIYPAMKRFLKKNVKYNQYNLGIKGCIEIYDITHPKRRR